MSDISIGKISLEDQLFFINSNPIAGVQSLQYNTASNIGNLRYLGQKKHNFYANGVQGGRVNIDQVVISNDLFLPLTGASGFNGYIIKDKNTATNYSFASGYVSSYSVKGGIGNPVQVSVGVDIFGNMGTLITSDHPQITTDFTNITNHNYVDPELKFAHPQYTTVLTSDISSNRLQDFSIDIEVPRSPTYYLGKTEPDHVEINGPISINCSLQYEIDNYTMAKSKNKSATHTTDDITITLKTKGGSTIQTYSYADMELIEQSLSSSNNGNIIVDATYQKFI